MLTTITVVCSAGSRLFISVCVWPFVRPGRAGWIKFLPLCFLPPLRNFVPFLFFLSFFLFFPVFRSLSLSLCLSLFLPHFVRFSCFPVGEEWRIVDLVFLEDRFLPVRTIPLSSQTSHSQMCIITNISFRFFASCTCINCVEIIFIGKFFLFLFFFFFFSSSESSLSLFFWEGRGMKSFITRWKSLSLGHSPWHATQNTEIQNFDRPIYLNLGHLFVGRSSNVKGSVFFPWDFLEFVQDDVTFPLITLHGSRYTRHNISRTVDALYIAYTFHVRLAIQFENHH